MLSQFDITQSPSKLFITISSGFFLGLVTPGTFGELGRTLNSDIDASRGTATVLFEKFFDLLTLSFIASGSIIFMLLDFTPAVLIILILLVFLVLFFRRGVLKIIVRISPVKKLFNKYNVVYLVLSKLYKDKRLVLFSVMISFGLWTITAFQFYLILIALNISPRPDMVIVGCFVPYLASVLSLIPLGLGVLDFSMAGLLNSFFAVSNPVAYSVTIAFRLFATLPLVLWGYICYLYVIFKRKKLPVSA